MCVLIVLQIGNCLNVELSFVVALELCNLLFVNLSLNLFNDCFYLLFLILFKDVFSLIKIGSIQFLSLWFLITAVIFVEALSSVDFLCKFTLSL